MCKNTRRTLGPRVVEGLHVYCTNLKVGVTIQSSYDHRYCCLKNEFFSCGLMPEVIIMKKLRLLRYIFLRLCSCFGPQTTYLKYVRLFFRNILYRVFHDFRA